MRPWKGRTGTTDLPRRSVLGPLNRARFFYNTASGVHLRGGLNAYIDSIGPSQEQKAASAKKVFVHVTKKTPKAMSWRSHDRPMPGSIYRLQDDRRLQRGITYTIMPDGKGLRVPANTRLGVRAAAESHERDQHADIMQALTDILKGKVQPARQGARQPCPDRSAPAADSRCSVACRARRRAKACECCRGMIGNVAWE